MALRCRACSTPTKHSPPRCADFHDVDDEMGPSSDGTREDVAPEEDARVDRMSYEELLALGEVEGAVSKGAKAETLEVRGQQ